MNKTIAQKAMVLGGALLMASAVHAERDPSLYVAPFVGYQTFDHDLNLNDHSAVGLALGHQLSGNWAVELAYSQANTQADKPVGGDVDTNYWHLDALYQFPQGNKWTPYFVFGVGDAKLELKKDDYNDTQWNVGGGIQYDVNSRFAIRGDVRGLMMSEEVYAGSMTSLGVVFYLGHCTEKKAKPVAAPAPVAAKAVEPVPAPVVEKDTDGDGVLDSKDKCPDTSKGAKVDADGCYLALEGEKDFTLNVKFQTGKTVIQEDSKGQIAELAAFLTQYPQTSTVVEGHTDSDGSAEYNRALSQKRAEAVRQSLINDYKIDAARVSAIGYGEDKPIADNATAEGKAQNRRVVAKVSTKK